MRLVCRVSSLHSGSVTVVSETVDEDTPTDLSSYSRAFTKSWVYDDLNEVRNIRPSFATSLGLWGGVAYSGIDTLLLKGRAPWTFRHTKEETRKEYIVSNINILNQRTDLGPDRITFLERHAVIRLCTYGTCIQT